MLEAFVEAGISYIFVNFGSDHPGLVEAIAEARANGRAIPEIVTCPNEMVGMSAAHGFWQASGVPQAVVVHVECGTQALAGAVHNAAKGRAPMVIFAGASPYTQNGEEVGSRNEFIQWIQDVHDQRGIVRGYVKYDNEIRTGSNVKEIVHRALQLASSEPKGPVYLMGAREPMEQASPQKLTDMTRWTPVEPTGLPAGGVEELAAALAKARHPLIVTSYVGRKPEAVEALVGLCGTAGIGVLESVPMWHNFPHSDPLYLGNQWNEPRQNEALALADLVIVVDSDVPWIPVHSKPAPGTAIYHIDVDPLKTQMPLFHIDALRSWQADANLALRQVADRLAAMAQSPTDIAKRKAAWKRLHDKRREEIRSLEVYPQDGQITPHYAVACVRELVDDETLFVTESISNYPTVHNHLALDRAGSIFASGGGSLGYNGGAAIGVKLARPDKTVVAFTGDGSYMFSVPSSVHWMARRYETPFLQIVFNNRGWKSPKLSALAVHPDGYAAKANTLDVTFDPPPDYAGIAAAAGGAFAASVSDPAELRSVIAAALKVVREEKRCAVVDVHLAHL